MSDAIKAFMIYAEAFEKGFAADDWKLVDCLFDKDIIWSLAGPPPPFAYSASGNEAVSAGIRKSVDSSIGGSICGRRPSSKGRSPSPEASISNGALPIRVTVCRHSIYWARNGISSARAK